LAHFLLASKFSEPISTLGKTKKSILRSFCKHKSVWESDPEFTKLLKSLLLPTTKKELEAYLSEKS